MDLRKIPLSEELEALKREITKENSMGSGAGEVLDSDTALEVSETSIEGSVQEQKVSLLVTYSLSKKSRSKKMLFNYELIGRNGKDGFLQILGGEKVTSGCIIIPADNEEAIEDFLNRHEVDHSKRRILTFDAQNS